MAEGSGERWSSSDIVKAIQAGDMRVWMAVEDEAVRCVMLTEFSDYPGGRALRLIGLSGEGMLRWVRWWPRVQAFARVCECRWIEAVHPPQYRRLLERLAGKHFHAITEWTL